MDELTELIEDLSKIISIQNTALERLSSKLAEYIGAEEIEKLYDDSETKRLMEKWEK